MTQLDRGVSQGLHGRPSKAGLSLIVADPDPLARAYLVEACERSRFRVVAEAQTLGEALAAAGRYPSALIILAAAFYEFETTQELISDLRTVVPESAVVVTELPGANLDPVAAFAAGAVGYVIKDRDMGRWLPTMLHRYARDGVAPLSAGIPDEVIRELQGARRHSPDLGSLSDREIEVLILVSKGLSNQAMAVALGVGLSTIKTHVHSLLRKLQVSNRVHLALYARRQRFNRTTWRSRRRV